MIATGHHSGSRTTAPKEAKHFVVDDEDGLDLGLVHLEPMHQRMLRENGIQAFEEKAWRNPPRDMLRYAVIGFPDQFIERRATSSGFVQLSVSPTLVYLEGVAPPPEMAKPFPRFYGKLPDRLYNQHTGASLDGMKGFSGGPILGFKMNSEGQMKYFLVAVQSAWRPDLRVVVGPLMSVVAAELDGEMQ